MATRAPRRQRPSLGIWTVLLTTDELFGLQLSNQQCLTLIHCTKQTNKQTFCAFWVFQSQKRGISLLNSVRLKPKVPCSLGSGCGSVGRAVASDTRDPRFGKILSTKLSTNCKKVKKRLGMAHL